MILCQYYKMLERLFAFEKGRQIHPYSATVRGLGSVLLQDGMIFFEGVGFFLVFSP